VEDGQRRRQLTPLTEALQPFRRLAGHGPNSPNTLYLGLGDPDGTGIGLVNLRWRASWSAPVTRATRPSSTTSWCHRPRPTSLASTNMGLFRSTDSGGTFTVVPIATGQTVQPYVWSIASAEG
jgi:hypothetical protein